MSSLWFSSEVYFMSKVYTLFIPDFTEIADNQTIISYSMSREWGFITFNGFVDYQLITSVINFHDHELHTACFIRISTVCHVKSGCLCIHSS